jgi:hypothetical protein
VVRFQPGGNYELSTISSELAIIAFQELLVPGKPLLPVHGS